jgi:hypothetical protein
VPPLNLHLLSSGLRELLQATLEVVLYYTIRMRLPGQNLPFGPMTFGEINFALSNRPAPSWSATDLRWGGWPVIIFQNCLEVVFDPGDAAGSVVLLNYHLEHSWVPGVLLLGDSSATHSHLASYVAYGTEKCLVLLTCGRCVMETRCMIRLRASHREIIRIVMSFIYCWRDTLLLGNLARRHAAPVRWYWSLQRI